MTLKISRECFAFTFLTIVLRFSHFLSSFFYLFYRKAISESWTTERVLANARIIYYFERARRFANLIDQIQLDGAKKDKLNFRHSREYENVKKNWIIIMIIRIFVWAKDESGPALRTPNRTPWISQLKIWIVDRLERVTRNCSSEMLVYANILYSIFDLLH